jgi:hypothetical protein
VGVVYRFTGEGWEETGSLDNAVSVYALLEGPGQVLYAGATFTDDTGRVFRSFNGGESWEPSGPLGESQAVRALLEGAAGRCSTSNQANVPPSPTRTVCCPLSGAGCRR